MIINEEIKLIKEEITKIYESMSPVSKQSSDTLLMLASLIEVLKDNKTITQQELDVKENNLRTKVLNK